MKILNLALCAGRHEIPDATDGCLFKTIPQKYITDPEFLEDLAFSSLWKVAHKNGLTRGVIIGEVGDEYLEEIIPGIQLNLYVTGLTVALIAAVNVARQNKMDVVLYHFNRDSGKYFPQEIY